MLELGRLRTVCLTKAIRTFGFGFVSVILALFLVDRGFNTAAVGAIFSATILEDAILTACISALAARVGVKPILLVSCLLVALCGAALATTVVPWIIVCAVVFGIVSPAGYEGGPFSPLEQTIISDSVPSEKLTQAFSCYNLTGFGGAALGALFAGAATAFAHAHQFAGFYQAMFWLYAFSGVVQAVLYLRIKGREFDAPNAPAKNGSSNNDTKPKPTQGLALKESKGNVFKLAGLQAMDAFGGGFIPQSLIAYWFFVRFHAGAEFTGPVFFWANVLAAISFIGAPLVVKKLGLLRTMVFTHLPCSLALCLIPFMPDASAVAFVILARSLWSSIDIPVRQAFGMLLVSPDERPAAAGIISAFRAVSQGTSPLVSGLTMGGAAATFGLPFIFAGAIKSVYDIGLYVCFSGVPLHGETVESITDESTDCERNSAGKALSVGNAGEIAVADSAAAVAALGPQKESVLTTN